MLSVPPCLSSSDETSAESSVGKLRDTVKIKVSLRQLKVALKTAAMCLQCIVMLVDVL